MTGSGITITRSEGTADSKQEPQFIVAGDFDATQVDRFNTAVSTLPDNVAVVTVDISACTVLDSSALGALIDLKHRLDGLSAALVTVADKPFQRLILQHTGLADYLGSTE